MAEPTVTQRSYQSLVAEVEPGLYDDLTGYKFSTGRIFKSTDKVTSGIYGLIAPLEIPFVLDDHAILHE